MTSNDFVIPETFQLFGMTLDAHWNYHAVFMAFLWGVLLPACLISLRYYKPKPTFTGLTTKLVWKNLDWFFFTTHKYGLYFVIFASVIAGLLAMFIVGGYSGTLHSKFGLLTVVFGVLQGVSAHNRGRHGGKHYVTADPDDPKTWWGDHYNMTPRRRFFEAFHKTVGYFNLGFAFLAIVTGLMQYKMPALASLMIAIVVISLVWSVLREYQGKRYDTYRVCFGYDPDAPHNKEREHL